MLITPDFVDLWEAIVTFLFFPLLVVIAYMTDKDYCSKKQEAEGAEIGEFGIGESGLFLEISFGGGGGEVVGGGGWGWGGGGGEGVGWGGSGGGKRK